MDTCVCACALCGVTRERDSVFDCSRVKAYTGHASCSGEAYCSGVSYDKYPTPLQFRAVALSEQLHEPATNRPGQVRRSSSGTHARSDRSYAMHTRCVTTSSALENICPAL